MNTTTRLLVQVPADRSEEFFLITTAPVDDIDLDRDEDEEEWEWRVMELAAARIAAARARLERLGMWAAAVWRVESTWRPLGFRLYVVLLVDPMAPRGAPPSDPVWAGALNRTLPVQPPEQWDAFLSLGRGWRDRLPVLVAEATQLRDAG